MRKIKSILLQLFALMSAALAVKSYVSQRRVKQQQEKINVQKQELEALQAVHRESEKVASAKAGAERDNVAAERARKSLSVNARRAGRFGSAHRLRE